MRCEQLFEAPIAGRPEGTYHDVSNDRILGSDLSFITCDYGIVERHLLIKHLACDGDTSGESLPDVREHLTGTLRKALTLGMEALELGKERP